VEVRVRESQHDELHGADGHVSLQTTRRKSRASVCRPRRRRRCTSSSCNDCPGPDARTPHPKGVRQSMQHGHHLSSRSFRSTHAGGNPDNGRVRPEDLTVRRVVPGGHSPSGLSNRW
jgi:hypothetical protein